MRPDRHQGPFVLLRELVLELSRYRSVRLSHTLTAEQERARHFWRVRLVERGPDTPFGRPGPELWTQDVEAPFDDEAAQAAADLVIERYAEVLGPEAIARARALARKSLEPVPRRGRG
jgi:hypothetical protein